MIAALLLLAAEPVVSRPTLADIMMVRKLVGEDAAYTPAARREALSEVAKLPALVRNPAGFELKVAHIIALANNGHSALFPPGWTQRYPRSTVRLGRFADGIYVIAAPDAQKRVVGQKVVSINGFAIARLTSAYTNYQGGTQAWRDQFITYFLESPAMLAAAGLGRADGRLGIGLAGGGAVRADAVMAPLDGMAAFIGEPVARKASGLIRGAKPLYLQHPDRPFLFEPKGPSGAAYIRLDGIGGDGFEAFLKSTLSKLGQSHQKDIVLDLRFNPGGDLNRARDFAKALPNLAKGGHVYAITSGGTFSAAISTLGYLKQAGGKKVRIVGEPVGDRLEFYAEGEPAKLPGLGAMVLIAHERHNYRTGCPQKDCHAAIRDNPIRVASLQPDLPAPMTFASYRAGRDPAMEAIISDIRTQH